MPERQTYYLATWRCLRYKRGQNQDLGINPSEIYFGRPSKSPGHLRDMLAEGYRYNQRGLTFPRTFRLHMNDLPCTRVNVIIDNFNLLA